jgi:hypothetical protein
MHGLVGIWKEITTGRLMDGPNSPTPELRMDPFRRDIESLSQLRHRQAAFDGRPSGLSVHRFDAMPKPDTTNCTRQDRSTAPG